MSDFLPELLFELRQSKGLMDKALAQLDEQEFFRRPAAHVNSVAGIVKHLAGNLASRWTDFLTSDGEKPSRGRDAEFLIAEADTREGLMAAWERGLAAFFSTVEGLKESGLARMVTIRGEAHSALQALLRGANHVTYHAGQILYVVRLPRPDSAWLTVAPGQGPKQLGSYRREA